MFLQNKYTTWYYQIIAKATNRMPTGYTEQHHIIPRALGGGDATTNLVKLTAREHFICHLLLPKMVNLEYRVAMCFALFMMTANNQNQQRNNKINSKLFEKLRIELSIAMKLKWTPELRNLRSKEMKGENNPFYGKHHSAETIDKLKNKTTTAATRQLLSDAAKLRFENRSGTSLGRSHSAETRTKMSIAASNPKSEKWKISASLNRTGRAAPNKGIPATVETRKKISDAVKGEKNGFFGKQHSLEQRLKKKKEKLESIKKLCYYCNKAVDAMNYGRWHGDKCKYRK